MVLWTPFVTCGRFRSTIDYILLPSCWFEKIPNAKTFCLSVDNTSDHVPMQTDTDLPFISVLPLGGEVRQFTNIMKIRWNDCSSTEIDEKYVSPYIVCKNDLNELDFADSISIEELTKTLTEAIVTQPALRLLQSVQITRARSRTSGWLNTLRWPGKIIPLHLKPGKAMTLLIHVRFSIITSQLRLFIVQNFVTSSIRKSTRK